MNAACGVPLQAVGRGAARGVCAQRVAAGHQEEPAAEHSGRDRADVLARPAR